MWKEDDSTSWAKEETETWDFAKVIFSYLGNVYEI